MSSIFYSYLSDRIIDHFKNNNPKAGDKFSVSFEKDLAVSIVLPVSIQRIFYIENMEITMSQVR